LAIEDISDTARWVAVYRAMESARPDAIFRDLFAERLAGRRGREILDEMPHGRTHAWTMIVRTAVFDEIILDVVERQEVDLVVNLGAGLDARPWRLPLPPSLRWVDVDLPQILHYKTGMLRDETLRCRYEAAAADLRETAVRQGLFSWLGASSSRALVVSEGLLLYLTPEQVATLAVDLHGQPSFAAWLFDLRPPRRFRRRALFRRRGRSWGEKMAASGTPFQFAPAQGTGFFRPYGWRDAQFRSMWEEGQRLHRTMRGGWFWTLIGRLFPERVREEGFRRFTGIVLLDRDERVELAHAPSAS
jgi:methyltransferase (TIGR00027 family)